MVWELKVDSLDALVKLLHPKSPGRVASDSPSTIRARYKRYVERARRPQSHEHLSDSFALWFVTLLW